MLETSIEEYDNDFQPSLCIPRVSKFVTETDIRDLINRYRLGKVSSVDVIFKRGEDDCFKRIFIHFSGWGKTDDALVAKQRLLAGKDFKLTHDYPNFWIFALSTSKPRQSVSCNRYIPPFKRV